MVVVTEGDKPMSAARVKLSRRGVVLGAAGLSTALAACVPGNQGAPAAVNTTPATIRWRTATTDQWAAAAPMFQQKFPHITVEIATQETGWQEKNLAEWLAGTGPDISAGFNQFLPEWSRKGLLQKLDDRIKRDFTAKQLQDYSQEQWKFFSTKEKGQHAMPFYMATAVLGYNKDLFRRAGVAFPDETWDWNKYADAMRRLSDKNADQFGGQIGATLPR